ncbi:MAG: hypothetical protein WAL92_01555, partial [Thiogranum sp.]
DVNGVTFYRMFNAASSAKGVPQYISSDNDPLFPIHRWQETLRILDIQEYRIPSLRTFVAPVRRTAVS